MNRAFISYRVADCPDVAGRLDADLSRALGGDAVFRDRTRLVGGQAWTTEIESQARSCRIMLVLIGPSWQTAAFPDGARKGFPRLSDPQDWVRREIEISLRADNVVIPVYVNGADIPSEGWLATCGLGRLHDRHGVRLNAADYDAHLANLLAMLHAHGFERPPRASDAPVVNRRDFYRHIALPPNYVPRGPALAELLSAMFSEQTVAVTSGMPAKPAALHGMGGVGKSVLARALCEQLEVRAAFPDGILWTTLGQTPDLKACLREWLGALGVTVPGTAPTINELAEGLAAALEMRACLLVVDDVWAAEHLRPFTARGPRCRLLLTTRNAALARQFGARVHSVHAMARDEALRLLEAWADGHLAGVPTLTKEAILDELGGLPLAIKLAGAQLQRMPANGWLTSFEGARGLDTGWGAIDRDSSIAICFHVSMAALDDRARRLYAGLGIFREDESIPITAVTRLWTEWGGVTPQDARRLCHALADHALVDLIPGGEALVLHDLLRDITVEMLGDQQAGAHASLVAAYARTRAGSMWPTADDDGYLYDHLVYHLAGARDMDSLRRLFEDDRWMWARLRRSDHRLDGYLGDLDRFWGMAMTAAQDQIAADEAPEALVDCMSCALIQTTINSGTSTYPPHVMARAVELGLWSLDRALSTLNRIPDEGRRFDCLVALLGLRSLSSEARHHVSGIALAAAPTRWHSVVDELGRLASCVDDAHVPRVLSGILRVDLHSHDVMYMPGAIAAILPRTDEAQRLAILEIAEAIPAEYGSHTPRHAVLAVLAAHVPESQLTRALRVAIEAPSKDRIRSIVAFFPRIDAARRDELIALAWNEALAMPATMPRGLSSYVTNTRARGLACLAPFAGPERQREASALCLHDIRAMDDPDDIRTVLKAFAPFFEADDLPGVLDVVRALPEDSGSGLFPRVEAIAQLANRLHVVGMNEPIEEAVSFVFQHGEGMHLLAPLLPSSWKTKCVERFLGESVSGRVRLAAQLLPHLRLRERVDLLRACPISHLLGAESVDWDLATHDLPPDLFGDLVDAMIEFPDKGAMSSRGGLSGFYSLRERHLMAVASQLSPDQVLRCVNARPRIRDELPLVGSVVRLLPVIPAQRRAIDVALAIVLRMPEEEEATPPARELALEALAVHLSVDQLAICVQTIERGTIPLTQVFGLTAILPHLRDELREQALASARSKVAAADADQWQYPLALAAVVPFLPARERPLAAEQVLAHLRLGLPGNQEALESVIPFLQPAALRRLMKQLQESSYVNRLFDVVRALEPDLTTGEIRELAEYLDTRTVEDPDQSRQTHHLARLQLISHLDGTHRDAIVASVFEELRASWSFYWIDDDLYKKIIDLLPADRIGSALDIALDIEKSSRRIGALRALIPRLDAASGNKAMDVLLADILALDGLDAIGELDAAFHFLAGSSDHRRLMRRELVSRLHASRNKDRRTVLSALQSQLLSEALFPRCVLAAIATKLLAVCNDWAWP